MIKVLKGKKYDTETAKYLLGTTNGYGCGDIYYVSEDLYLKKTGEYFLYGRGGAYSKYNEQCGDGVCGGSQIVPLSIGEAKQWVMDNFDGEEYIKLFGDVEE